MNKIMLIGRLGQNPELKYSQNGSPILNMSIATDESYTNREGNKIEQTEWHRVVAYQKNAENCAKYLVKGSLVFIEGKLQTRKWQDKSGQDRYTTEIIINRIQFLEKKTSSTQVNQNTSPYQAAPAYNEHTSDFDEACYMRESAIDVMPF